MTSQFDLSLDLDGPYGGLPASRLNISSDRVIAVPFDFELPPFSNLNVAIFAHIFYPELSDEIACCLDNIPAKFDLFISTDTTEKKREIARRFERFSSRCSIEVFPNRGRDIAPFIVGFAREIPKYDIISHLHSKHSKHNDILSGWRGYLLHHLYGSPAIVASILFALQSGNVDLLFPDHYEPVRQSLNYGFDFEHIKLLLERARVPFSKDILLDFPSGSMFWAKSRALKPLLDLELRFEDFPEEDGQIDGTLAHAIERSFVFLTEAAGLNWAKFASRFQFDDTSRLVSVSRPADVPLAVTRASRRLLGNRISTNLKPRLVGELNPLTFRGERSSRPRLTLLIPTLKPDKTFGGVASALRLFNEILSHVDRDIDTRIVSVTDDVDVECLTALGDYTLVSLGADHTELSRTVVDASQISSNQLPVRKREVFLATAWWTAYLGFRARDMQQSIYGAAPALYYFIQDHEPDFYGWSAQYALSRSTYLRPTETKAIINSEELYNFLAERYELHDACYVPYAINRRLRNAFISHQKERMILVYARPGTPRNAFEILVDGLCLWQQANPTIARSWCIVAAGENFDLWRTQHVANLESVGKLSLEHYADFLCRASVGVSLMLSPHPSYPPLEMAEAGVITVTNKHENKDLSLRAQNIISVEPLTADTLAQAIAQAVQKADAIVGNPASFREIDDIPCTGQIYSARSLALSIVENFS